MSLAFVRQLEGTGVTLNVAYPGRAETDIMKPQSEPPLPLRIVFGVVNRFVPHGEETVIQAARCSIYLASSSEVEGKTGGFYNPNTKAGKFPASARDEATQREVMAAVTRRTSHSEQVHV
jgi:NAD(P)-dependent dehydrogenase (short-subunit alcohol dehydrogenase family)